MKSWFTIAGKKILLEGAGSRARRFFRGFETGEGEPFMTFKAELPGEETLPESSEDDLLFGLKVSRCTGAYTYRFEPRQGTGEYLLASADLAECRIVSKPIITGEMPENCADEPRWRGLILGALAAKGALAGMLLAHASAVEYKGESVIFTAPSGSGKTTQAELWEKILGAKILNGDKVFISRKEKEFYAYGSPWAGSSPYRENRGAPMKAVIVLEKGQENTIRKLSDEELLRYFVPNVFLPYWEEELLTSALGTLDELVTSVPVYLLSCRPDEDAVRMTEKVVFGD